MDKNTLSNYGWVVICTLVLAVMIALATPFGEFIGKAVDNTLQGLIQVSDNALEVAIGNASGTVTPDEGDDIVPDDGGDDIVGEEGSENNGPQLASPTISMNDDGTITVNAVESATSYTIELAMNGYDRDPVFYTSNTAPFTVDLRDIIANTGDSRLYGMNLKLNICAYADGYTSSAYTLTNVKISQLTAPEISIDYMTLNITPVNGATAYEIYIDGVLQGTITETTIDLWQEYNSRSDGDYEVTVIAIDNQYGIGIDSTPVSTNWHINEDAGLDLDFGDDEGNFDNIF